MATYQQYNYNNDYNSNGGGGFQTSTSYNNADSSSQSRNQPRTTITPVTIKQLNESAQLVPDGEFTINNVELTNVSVIGVVRNVVDNTANLNITIEDGTGSFEFKKWIDDSDAEQNGASPAEEFPIGKYVQVTGSLKEFNGRKNIQYATVRPVVDHNQVIYHHLSAISVHLQAQGVSSNGAASSSANGNGLFVSEPAASEVPKSNVDRIFAFIHEQTPSMPEGVPIQLISQTLGLMVEDVQLHTAKLTEDGKIYHGYDDNGFLAV